MDKRTKRTLKGIDSIKKEIEKHFIKIDEDIAENRLERAEYHFKEINRSFLPALENKIKITNSSDKELNHLKDKLESKKKKINFK